MKVDKDNKVKLARNERRLGNFVVKDETEHVKIMDIGQLFTHRASKNTPAGMFLKQCYDALTKDESTGRGLSNWIACLFTVFSVIPDVEFMEKIIDASRECMERHPEAYGYPATQPTDEEDARIIQEEKELRDFEERVKNTPDETETAQTIA